MKHMSAILFAAVVLSAAVSCSKPAVYYPLYHYVGLSSTLEKAANGKIDSYLNWGDKLLATGKSVTVTNNSSNFSVYVEVKSVVDNSTGWVDLGKVITNAATRGVILGNSIAYSTPTVSARNTQSITPPLLCYILETKDGEWARILPYQSQNYTLSNITWLPGDLDWVALKDISTNQSDVDVMVAVQFRTRKFKEAAIALGQNPNDAAQKANYDKTLSELKTDLSAIIQKYPQSGSVKYANELLDAMFPPAVETNTADTNSGTPSGSNETL
jgi:hypothetical protein